MNQIESAIPFMKQLADELEIKKGRLINALNRVGLRPVDLEQPLLRIQEQISSAETKFTIAFVGTFKTGKSTIINSLLELKGDSCLSSEFEADTAKCIRIMKKQPNQDYEAEILFDDGRPSERISWVDAKQYTSQVALNASSLLAEKAKRIEEVRYFVDHPFLELCNILDLPGTGTGSHAEHTEVTDRKIMEADCVFWVVSTDVEPDKSSIENLEKISTKMLPIINVWQDEAEDIYSELAPEDIRDMLFTQFSGYFSDYYEPIFYYAREIERAQEEGTELKPEWGKEAFTNTVSDILHNIRSGDRMKRIQNHLQSALTNYRSTVMSLLDEQEIIKMSEGNEDEKLQVKRLQSRIVKAYGMAKADIKTHASMATKEILEILTDASNAFIENQMQGISLTALFRKKKSEADLREDFEKNYVKLDGKWISEHIKSFNDDVCTILEGIYRDLELEESETVNVQAQNAFERLDKDEISGFIKDMVSIIHKDAAGRILPSIIAAVGGGILMSIPGGTILEAIATVLTSGSYAIKAVSEENKLRRKIDGVKAAANVQIRQQRAMLVNTMLESANQMNEKYKEGFMSVLEKRLNANEMKAKKLLDLRALIKEIVEYIDDQFNEIALL